VLLIDQIGIIHPEMALQRIVDRVAFNSFTPKDGKFLNAIRPMDMSTGKAAAKAEYYMKAASKFLGKLL
jgi:hypothetical protein